MKKGLIVLALSTLVTVGSVVFAPGCSTTNLSSPSAASTEYKVGAASKAMAETAYKAIYAAHKKGLVGDAAMAQADKAYDAWATAQTVYIAAVSAGQGDKTNARLELQKVLMDLTALAAQHGLL